MDLFGMGFGEIILVIIVALIIFGPGKIPEMARQAGKLMRTLKQTSSELTSQIQKELEAEERAIMSPPELSNQKPLQPPPSSEAAEGADTPADLASGEKLATK